MRSELRDPLVLVSMSTRPDAHVKVAIHPDEDFPILDVILRFSLFLGPSPSRPSWNIANADDRCSYVSCIEQIRLKWKAVSYVRHVEELLNIPPFWNWAKGRVDARDFLVAGETEVD